MLSESGFSLTASNDEQQTNTCRTISSNSLDQTSENFFDKRKLLEQTKTYIHNSLASHGLDWQDDLKCEKEILKSKMTDLEATVENLHKKLGHLYSEASDLTDSYEKVSVSIESDLDTKTVFQSILDQRLSEEDLVTTLAFIRKFFQLICQKVEIEYEDSDNFDSDGEKIALKQLCFNLENRKSSSSASSSSVQTNLNSLVIPPAGRVSEDENQESLQAGNYKKDKENSNYTQNRPRPTSPRYSPSLNLIKIHKLRRISQTLSLAYDRVAKSMGFDNSGSSSSYLLELVKFYYNFSGDRITKTDQLKATIDKVEIGKFIAHLNGSVQDTRLLKALIDCINVVKRCVGI